MPSETRRDRDVLTFRDVRDVGPDRQWPVGSLEGGCRVTPRIDSNIISEVLQAGVSETLDESV